jgi:hypothetical protein
VLVSEYGFCKPHEFASTKSSLWILVVLRFAAQRAIAFATEMVTRDLSADPGPSPAIVVDFSDHAIANDCAALPAK